MVEVVISLLEVPSQSAKTFELLGKGAKVRGLDVVKVVGGLHLEEIND